MNKKINPVYGKELKMSVRTFKFAITVMVYNLILIGIALFGFEIVFNVNWNSVVDYAGVTKIYMILVVLEIGMLLFIIPASTAGSIAGEREKQTLEILLTTTLRPYQIILGKLLSSISMALLLVFSSLPVVSIVFTIGGVGLMDLLQFVLVAMVTAVFIGSVGMFASTIFKRTVHATVLSFGLVLVICGLSVVIALGAYLLSQMYYYNVMHSVGNPPNVAWAALPLLLNPAVTIVGMMFDQYGEYRLMQGVISQMGGLPSFVGNHWFVWSILAQMLGAVGMLYLAQRHLNPLRKIKYREKKVSKKKKKIV